MLLTTLVLAASLVGADGPVSAPFEPACAHAKTAAVLLGGPPELLQAGDTDVLHYDLDIEIDPGAESIGGSNTMTVRSVVDGLSVFPFRLDDVFTIGTLTVDGTAAAWQRIDGATVEVTLGHPYDADQTFELRVEYAGVPDGGGFGSIRFRTRSGAPEVWTLSEPWFAHTWWPAKDDSTDKTTADLWFTVPGNMVVASNGVLQGVDDVGGGQLRYRWRTDYPTADYLYCIGATNYETFGGTWTYGSASMPLDFYIYPEDDTQGNRDAWMENLDILDVFSDAYGIYPFADEKYGMCQVGFGGGMEHQTMTSQGGFWESTTAHEAAHQWWGDMVTCATWHDIWLNEGFATFSEAIWYGNKPGSPGMSAYHDRMDARRPSAVNDSVYVYDISSVNRIFSSNFTYRKGAWVLHMLRHVLGDETFFDVLADYRAAFEYGSATTEDLRAVAEATAGRELAWFFDEWVYDIGAPEYRWAWQSHEVRGRSFVEVYVEQVQPASYPIFAMPVDVVTVGPGGGETHAVWNDADAEHLLFETAGAVSAATLDPEDWILHDPIAPAAFVEGPPKVVDTSPAPGSIVAAGAVTTVEILLHKTVVVEAANVTLAGETTGMVPFVFGYDAPAITLDFDAPLPADEYVLTVDDAVVDGAAGLALDGEVIDGALPSGDGLPGGAAIVRFTVEAAPGDVDGDGVIGFGDLLVVLSTWGPCPPPPCAGDANGDGTVDFADVLLVLSNWS